MAINNKIDFGFKDWVYELKMTDFAVNNGRICFGADVAQCYTCGCDVKLVDDVYQHIGPGAGCKPKLGFGIDKWALGLSKYIKPEHRLVVASGGPVCFAHNETGIQFAGVGADTAAVDAAFTCDWVFDCRTCETWSVEVGGFGVCAVNPQLVAAVGCAANNVFLYTGDGWIYLDKRTTYVVEIMGARREVWIGSPMSFDEMLEATCLGDVLNSDGMMYFKMGGGGGSGSKVKVLYARCEKSMWLLDDIHRDYIQSRVWSAGEIVAVKSVAGSGKTTTLLSLAKTHRNKRMLYLAFNKSLITEIGSKLKKQNITNLEPRTFDSLLYGLYRHHKQTDPVPVNLRPQNVGEYSSWLRDKDFGLRKGIVTNFSKWCNNHTHYDIEEFCLKVLGKASALVTGLWATSTAGKLTTFETIRKMALIGHWCKEYIDANYDMILIDETQDFDMMMLKMLLDDTTLPRLFVGDTKQAIYEWRGCINAFDHLPASTTYVEFYSTFRVGEPACSIIRAQFNDCWMISKSARSTSIGLGTVGDGVKYVYLFRTWRVLLQTAQNLKDTWIYGFDKQMETMRKLHGLLLANPNRKFDADDFDDDITAFLKKITADELEALIAGIEAGLVDKRKAICQIYTVHAYKGLEHEVVRLSYDIDKKKDENIYYVACTRGMDKILFDAVPPSEQSFAASVLRGAKAPVKAVSGAVKKPVVPFGGGLLDNNDCNGNGDCLEQCGHAGHNGYCAMGQPCVHGCVPVACKNAATHKCKTLYPQWLIDTHKGLCWDCRRKA